MRNVLSVLGLFAAAAVSVNCHSFWTVLAAYVFFEVVVLTWRPRASTMTKFAIFIIAGLPGLFFIQVGELYLRFMFWLFNKEKMDRQMEAMKNER